MATLVSKKKALAKNRSKPQKVLNKNCCLKTFDKRGVLTTASDKPQTTKRSVLDAIN